MSKRKENKETFVNNRRVVGVIEAAKILTRRASTQHSERVYSRDTIYRHYKDGALVPAMETPAGNLYYVEDIEALPISPERGAKSGKPHRKKQDPESSEISINTP